MTTTSSLVSDNRCVLEQAAALLRGLGAEPYAAPGPARARSGVGGHIRHVLDFYDCFLRGLPLGRVDYEARARDERVACDPVHAIAKIEETLERLDRMGTPCSFFQLLVRAEGSRRPGSPAEWRRSSAARELEFLLSHTIHHFALVALMLRLRGVEPGEEFGVAPSTLAYWRSAS